MCLVKCRTSSVTLDNTIDRDQAKLNLQMETAAVFTPVVRIFLMLVSLYYAVNTVTLLMTFTGKERTLITSLSSISCIAAAMTYCSLKAQNTLIRLEFAGVVGNGLLLINLLYHFSVGFDSSQLVYFVLLVFVFPLTGATRRVAMLFSAVSLACLYRIILAYDPSYFVDYVFIGIASCIVSFGGSFMLRRIILDALNSKLIAAHHKIEALEAAAHATKLAVTDNLTSLPNRRDFFDKLKKRAEEYYEARKTLTVLLIDLDGFKPVNDTYGHSVGDSLLVDVGKRLQTSLPEDTYIARIGGDEFAAIVASDSREDAQKLGDAVCAAMRAPFNLGRILVHVGATVGAARRNESCTTELNLVENADFALYNAKRNNKGTCAVFTPSDAAIMTRLFFVDQALRRSDLEKELTVVYQPQFDISSNTVTGFEALARWNSTELGKVDPETFITVAETTGMITKVTLTLLRKAMRSARSWPETANLSFNLSVHDVLDMSAIDEILSIVRRAGVDPSRICFEITETVMMGDVEKAGLALQKIVDAGHDVALDDFGTGYSNFTYLNKLPISKIKIDRSFIRDMSQGESSVQTIATLLQMARSLNKGCIVEGVETEAEFAAVKGLGAQIIQGYFCGRPMLADNVETLLAEQEAYLSSDTARDIA